VKLARKELIGIHARLFQNRPQSTFGHIAGKVRYRDVTIARSIEPDLVTSRCLPVERKPTGVQFSSNFAISKTG